MWRRALAVGLTFVLCAVSAGCVGHTLARTADVLTIYVPGVGIDLGHSNIREGLRRAGYLGEILRVSWSYTMNPVLDQSLRVFARQGGKRLAAKIQAYLDANPGAEVNIIAVSAGTGVTAWALEALKPEYKVNNVVFIASSLQYRYDVAAAMTRVAGRLYNYYSPVDAVLATLMTPFGTIDGRFFVPAAGEIGLQIPAPCIERIVNIQWRPEFARFGYYGGHFDGTNPEFIAAVVARHLTRAETGAPPETTPASRLERYSRAVPRD